VRSIESSFPAYFVKAFNLLVDATNGLHATELVD
jgi:hypothetical protein